MTGEPIDAALTPLLSRYGFDEALFERLRQRLRSARGDAEDNRLRGRGDAVDLVRSKRRPDGRWPKGSQYTGETFFTLEPGRVPGRWNTLRALRVLRWWEQGGP